jgi:hypothetical protein
MLSERCRECPYVDTCDHKRAEAIAYIETPGRGSAISEALIAGIINGPVIIAPHKVEFDNPSEYLQKEDVMLEIYKEIYSFLESEEERLKNEK